MTVPRTDLALEAAEDLTAAGRFAALGSGVSKWECVQGGCPVTHIRVRDRAAAEALGRPVGRYVTIDLWPALERQEGLTRRAASCLAQQLRPLLPPPDGQTQFLVVGLGNSAMTPDAIGPLAVDSLLVTRHMVRAMPAQFGRFTPVSALCTGVLAQTGLETLELVQSAAQRVKPTAVIAIDALAARSRHRLCATVQLSDTGLIPGSGVGNHRRAIDRAALGVPVIAIGVPTVIDGAALQGEDAPPSGLFVTPQDIDQRVRELGRLIGIGVTLALQPHLTLEDVNALTG